MIELRDVTKQFGRVAAVRRLSLRLPENRIIGLLGQNGAGKTTALNMMTGYFPPTSGQVMVDGMDMLHQPRQCKRKLGYLPQQPPLYPEMTVQDYLTFVCRLKEVLPSAIPAHIREVIHRCGLEEVSHRAIGALSGGYRQRAGFAQALCGNPPILILDEPTVGLDPRQVVEIRKLIRSLEKDHTVVFSSHLLPEVQELCTHVVILHQGMKVHEGPLHPSEGQFRYLMTIEGTKEPLIQGFRGTPAVMDWAFLPGEKTGEVQVQVTLDPRTEADPRKLLFHLLCAMDAPILSMIPVEDSLEQIFLQVTARTDPPAHAG